MKEGKPSQTAEIQAMRRAIESTKPEDERICYDPYAQHFLSTRYRIIGKSHFLASALHWYLYERRLPGFFGFTVARVRYMDDYSESCVKDGIKQLVILGAGYDSRAYRIEGLKGRVMVFEVDHTATQRVKEEKIKKIFGSLPDDVVYVAIDFDKERLDKRLFESGYDRNVKTLFIWEGVTPFLTAEAVDETLAFVVNNSGKESSIVFDYLVRSDEYTPSEQRLIGKLTGLHSQMGELLKFSIQRSAVEEFLSKRGFNRVVNATIDDLKDLYFRGKNERRRVFAPVAIVHATVKPQG